MAIPEPIHSQQHIRVKSCRHGVMLYNINDQYVGRSLDLYGEYSEAEFHFFSKYLGPGMLVIDVGANIGCHTVFMAKAVGPTGAVIALEAQRQLYQTLNANAQLNALGNVHTLHAAAGAEEGNIMVPPVDYESQGNFGGVSLIDQGANTDGELVRLTTIDGLSLPNCHFIKIDVEGMEADVIRGATGTIKAHSPALYVENDRQEKSPELIELLFSLDYRLYWDMPALFNPDNFFQNPENIFSGTVSLNMICIPKIINQNMSGLTEITGPGDWPV